MRQLPRRRFRPFHEVIRAGKTQRIERRPAIRVLLMSGYADESLECYDLDSSMAFLQKPITPESLTRRVREVLDRPEVPAAATTAF